MKSIFTEQERTIIDTAMKLDPEQLQYVIDLMEYISTAPEEKKDRITAFLTEQAENYHLRTAAGRTAFLQAVQAI